MGKSADSPLKDEQAPAHKTLIFAWLEPEETPGSQVSDATKEEQFPFEDWVTLLLGS